VEVKSQSGLDHKLGNPVSESKELQEIYLSTKYRYQF